jgi:hypothetical protein
MPRSDDLRWAGLVAPCGSRIPGSLPRRAQPSRSGKPIDRSCGDRVTCRHRPAPCTARWNIEFLQSQGGMTPSFEILDRTGGAERPRAKSDKKMLPMLTIAEERRAPHCRLNCGRYSVYEDNDFGTLIARFHRLFALTLEVSLQSFVSSEGEVRKAAFSRGARASAERRGHEKSAAASNSPLDRAP